MDGEKIVARSNKRKQKNIYSLIYTSPLYSWMPLYPSYILESLIVVFLCWFSYQYNQHNNYYRGFQSNKGSDVRRTS